MVNVYSYYIWTWEVYSFWIDLTIQIIKIYRIVDIYSYNY